MYIGEIVVFQNDTFKISLHKKKYTIFQNHCVLFYCKFFDQLGFGFSFVEVSIKSKKFLANFREKIDNNVNFLN